MSVSAFADLGTELGIKLNPQGKPAFGIKYAYDVDAAWLLTYTTTMTNDILATLPARLKVNVVDTRTGAYLDSWKDVEKASLMIGQYKIDQRSVLISLLPSQRTLAVVFGVEEVDKKVTPKFNLNIGKLCQNSPDYFFDLTQGKNGCDVKASDLSDWVAECKEWADELLGYVKDNAITCTVAKAHCAEKGCGELTCP